MREAETLYKENITPREYFYSQEFIDAPAEKKSNIFVDEITRNGYLSLVLKDIVRGSLRGANKAAAKFFYNNSSFARHVLENPGGEQGLYDIYTYNPENDEYTKIDRFLLSRPACEGTRKRRDVYKNLLSESIKELHNDADCLFIADLGSGRGSIPLEVVYEHNSSNGKKKNIDITLVDKDARALETARHIAKIYGLHENTETINDNVKKFVKNAPHKYHIIGTHGLNDYFNDNDSIKFFDNIADTLETSGYLITTNMMPHKDKTSKFLMEKIGRWKLIYRTPEDMEKLVEKTGNYDIEDIIVVDDKHAYRLDSTEHSPDGFHVILRAKKKKNLFTLFS